MKISILILSAFLLLFSIKVLSQPVASFTIPAPPYCENSPILFTNTSTNTVSYYWDFGDGSFSNLENPSHTFSNIEDNFEFTVQLTVTDADDIQDNYSKTIYLTQFPHSGFDISPNEQEYPNTIFGIENWSNPTGDTYIWNFGDGNSIVETEFNEFFSYDYSKAESRWGTFNISLTVWKGGCYAAANHEITITAPLPNSDYNGSKSICGKNKVEMPANVNYTTPNVSEYQWFLYKENNQTAFDTINQKGFDYIFDDYSKYYAKLYATAEGSNPEWSYTYIRTDTIIVLEAPIINFNVSIRNGFTSEQEIYSYNETVDFNNFTENASSYIWNFGDGEKSDLHSPTHHYEENGEYYVSLIATNDENSCVDSLKYEKSIVISSSYLTFPTAFAPMRGLYPTFTPDYNEISVYQIKIVNRYGEIVFESNNIENGWDGTCNGRDCPASGYTYQATGRYKAGIEFKIKGNIVLIRY